MVSSTGQGQSSHHVSGAASRVALGDQDDATSGIVAYRDRHDRWPCTALFTSTDFDEGCHRVVGRGVNDQVDIGGTCAIGEKDRLRTACYGPHRLVTSDPVQPGAERDCFVALLTDPWVDQAA